MANRTGRSENLAVVGLKEITRGCETGIILFLRYNGPRIAQRCVELPITPMRQNRALLRTPRKRRANPTSIPFSAPTLKWMRRLSRRKSKAPKTPPGRHPAPSAPNPLCGISAASDATPNGILTTKIREKWAPICKSPIVRFFVLHRMRRQDRIYPLNLSAHMFRTIRGVLRNPL